MSEASRSLWPDAIRATVQSPYSVLQAQAEELKKQTAGLLVGQLLVRETEDDKVSLRFDIEVPALDGYRHRIMVVLHGRNMPYPAMVDAEVFRPTGFASFRAIEELLGGEAKKPINRADSDQELIELVGKVLQSPHVLSVAQSLIARATDVLARKGRQAAASAEPPQ